MCNLKLAFVLLFCTAVHGTALLNLHPVRRHPPHGAALGESPSKVMAWKRAGHIPAQTQAKVLEKGLAQGLPLTAEHVVFPWSPCA
jgi:hypothetical protein